MFYYTVYEARDIQELETSPDVHILIQITRSIDTAASHHKKSYTVYTYSYQQENVKVNRAAHNTSHRLLVGL